MLQSLTIEDFRSLRELTLSPLERVNLISGKNNTGKTALLKAIHLHSYPGDCVLSFSMNVQRGINSEKRFDNDSCGWLFHDKDEESGIELLGRKES